MSGFNCEKDQDGIVTVAMDMEGPVNALGKQFNALFSETMDGLENETGLTGVVFTSAKKTFLAGADLKEMESKKNASMEDMYAEGMNLKADMRRLELLKVPVVMAINGAAMGGGYELALLANHRVMLNKPNVMVGLPEVGLGLLPGGGGVVRMVNKHGFQAAMPFLLEGKSYRGPQALEAKLVDELVDEVDQLVPAGKAWIKANPDSWAQPWDIKGFKVPGGSALDGKLKGITSAMPAMTFKKTQGLMPAPERILDVAVQASYLDFEAAQRIETRAIMYLAKTPQAQNMINTMFLQMGKVNSGASRPKDVPPQKTEKLGILGAGLMGQGIAYAAAMVGIQVVLKDITIEAAETGKAYTDKLLSKRVNKGRLTEEKKQSVLNLILPTTEAKDLDGCDLIIEAVFEDQELKAKVTQEAEPMLAEGGVFASNTSALPITDLAEASCRPEKFIGAHFFSPVDKMPLVELICGENTDEIALAKLFDFSRQIKKTPIVVNDSRGFYTSRTIGSYIDEADKLLMQGVHPVRLERMAKAIGMPIGPLAIQDEIGLELGAKAAKANNDQGIENTVFDSSNATELGVKMVDELGRCGRLAGGGFYDYPEQGAKSIWPGLFEAFYKEDFVISDQDIKDRLLFRPVIESLKCLQTNVLKSVADGNVGSILGIGAPVWTGGYIQFVNTYGLQRFIDRCEELKATYNDEHFSVPEIVQEKIAANELFQ